MLSLSASQPTVSATRRTRLLRGADRAHHRFVDALDEIVPLLVQRVDPALGGRHQVVVVHSRAILLVPELDVRLREPRDQRPDRVVHAHPLETNGWAPGARCKYSTRWATARPP